MILKSEEQFLDKFISDGNNLILSITSILIELDFILFY